MNPYLNSKWQGRKNGKLITYQVTGIWGTGVKESYRVTEYELTQTVGGETVTVKAEDMRKWIEEKILIEVETFSPAY